MVTEKFTEIKNKVKKLNADNLSEFKNKLPLARIKKIMKMDKGVRVLFN